MKSLITLVFVASFISVHAETYFISPNGDNSNSGLSPSNAFLTIQHGVDVALAGDSVLVANGNYAGFVAMDNSGTSSNPILIMAVESNVNIYSPCSYNNLDGINVENVSWIIIDGFKVTGMPRTGIRTALSNHVTIRNNFCSANFKWGILTGFAENVIIENNECSYSTDEHGIYHSNSADNPIIRFNRSHHNNRCGIHMNGDVSMGGDGFISNASVYGNIIYENGAAGGSGINCDGVVNSNFYNNLLYENHASGISLYQIDAGAPSTGNKIFNNTIVNATNGRWCVNITENCSDNQIMNNILINQHPWRGSIVVAATALSGFVSDYNLVKDALSPDGDATVMTLNQWQNLGYDTHSQIAGSLTQLFYNAANENYHPINNSGQMIDAGTSQVSLVMNTDLDGISRPQGSGFDIGSYEFSGTTSLQTTPLMHDIIVSRSEIGYYLHPLQTGDQIIIYDTKGTRLFSTVSKNSEAFIPKEKLCMGMNLYQIITANGRSRKTGKLIYSEK